MKILILTVFLFSSFAINSQELDKDFLESLPKSMQEEVLKRAESGSLQEESVYRGITSQTELEKKNLEDLKKRLEEDLLFLEKQLAKEKDGEFDADDLILFGSDFFSTYQSTFMPINEPNLSSSYILDFGDILDIQLIGQKDLEEQFQIKRDGSINLPDVGKIKLAGLSLNEASLLIKAKVREAFVGTETFVSLFNVRDINVLVSGNAYKAGIYTISGNSNMLHALAVAGGINEYGSYREINLIRNKEVVATLDMYDVLITGEYDNNIQLNSGDVIFVKPIKKIVSVDGAVKIPARYELNENQNLSEALAYAGGLTNLADERNIFLDRILDGQVKSLPISNFKQFDDILAEDADKIFIRKYSLRSINIEGAVLRPGRYLVSEGESINDIIDKSGGYTENAYPFGAVYENARALTINKMAKELLYNDFIDNIIQASQKNPTGSTDLSSIIELTETLANTIPNGRIVVDLLDNTNSQIIRDGDKLTIPEKPGHIYIYGEVSYEGALKYIDDESLDYYISGSGGMKETANEKAIYVLHPNGDTQRTSVRKNIFQNNPSNQLKLYPGSIIFVPRAIDDSTSNRLAAQAYVSILGNIGIALASLSSINNNNN
jgi:protein involved in polysaccharide export with SLBB domain